MPADKFELESPRSILLRTLERVSVDAVEKSDLEGLRLRDGRHLGWDAILHIPANLPNADEWQAWKQQVGEPLYRLKFRLHRGDWKRASEIVDDISPEVLAGHSEMALWCSAARFKSHLASGNQERAVRPWLELARHPRRSLLTEKDLTEAGFDETQLRHGFSRQLWPVFFDELAAREELALLNAGEIDWNKQSKFAPVYVAALMQVVSDERPHLVSWLKEPLWDSPELVEWKKVFERSIAPANSGTEVLADPIARRIELFYRLQGDSLQRANIDSALRLVDLAASSVQGGEPIAASALDRSATILDELGRDVEAGRLRDWLRDQYPNTFHARQLRLK